MVESNLSLNVDIPLALKCFFFQIPGFCDEGLSTRITDIMDKDCDVLVRYKAVYRINFALAVFFFAFSLLMLNVKTSKDPRAAIHNGYVGIIYCFLVMVLYLRLHS